MSGFNVNCSDCIYCAVFKLEMSNWCVCVFKEKTILDIEQNIDCCHYVKRRKDVFEISD